MTLPNQTCHQCYYQNCESCINPDECGHTHWWFKYEQASRRIPQSVKEAYLRRHPSIGVWEDSEREAQSDLRPASQPGPHDSFIISN